MLEPNGLSRDHTERLLRHFGYAVTTRLPAYPPTHAEWIHFSPTGTITPFEFRVPGDISSAAFLLGAALLAEGGEIMLRDVGVNPTRDGFLRVVARMGALVSRENPREWLGEPVADLVARPARLRATTVEASEIPGLIDEIPMLAVLASRAEGTTRFHEVGELRVKESNRLVLIAENLTRLGVDAVVEGNDLLVAGTDKPPRGRVVTDGDHRIAMAFSVLGTVRGSRVSIDDTDCAEVSFPNFAAVLHGLRRCDDATMRR
jgi:3-phosphoshikimate 1-carboxyvinyltransferase